MKLIIEFQYFAPVILYKGLCSSTHLVYEQYERFQKMSFRNRLVIAGSDGPLQLTVPLRNGRNQRKLIREVLIDNSSSWQSIHWKSLVSCYNRSPWFEYYRDELNLLYTTRFDFLVDWDLACSNWILKQVGSSIPVSVTEEWKEEYDANEWEDWRGRLRPKDMQSAFANPLRYRQVFMDRTGFIPHLSILDLLFCEGKNAVHMLRQQ